MSFISALNFVLVAGVIIVQVAADKSLAFSLSRSLHQQSSHLARRDNSSSLSFENQGYESEVLHLVDINVGSPAQSLQLRLSSGDNSWLPDADSSLCDDDACIYGSFQKSRSKTYQKDKFPLYSTYLAEGTTFNDTISIGNFELDDWRLGLANVSDIPIGQLGLHPDPYSSSDPDSFVFRLKESGQIHTAAYSLFLGDSDSDNGAVLFSAIDKAKYTGDLIAAPISWTDAGITLSQIKISQPDPDADGYDEPYVEKFNDTMSASFYLEIQPMYLPYNWTNLIMYNVNGSVMKEYGAVVPCNTPGKDFVLEFQFGTPEGPRIEIPISGLMRPAMKDGSPLTSNGQKICHLDIWDIESWAKANGGSNNTLIFGESFMRHAYMVFNLETRNIALAQANLDATNSEIVEFTDENIPEASTVTKSTTMRIAATATVGTASGTLRTDYPTIPTGSAANGSPALSAPGWTISLILGLLVYQLNM